MFFFKITSHSVFLGVIITLILANTIVLALDRHPIDEAEYYVLEILNEIFSWCFFTEMMIKLIGLGIKEYSRDRYNLFDCMIVVISTIESILLLINVNCNIFI
jgi:hypothetical protein